MFNKMKKNARKAAIFSLVLAQVATCSIAAPMISASAFAGSAIQRNMENLDRGTVAVKSDSGVFVSWRRQATEPADTQFTLYRNQEKIAEGAITNFEDKNGTENDKYTVVKNGETMSKSVSVWKDGYLDIPLADPPLSDALMVNRNGIYYGEYAPGDSAVGDVDGDGEYEIIMLWNPSDAKDAASGGQTGKVYIDCYKLDGTQLWRIDMGYNIRAGAHDTQLMVADFNNDGKAELIVRTADGTTAADGTVVGNAEYGKDYASSWAAKDGGKNLQGPLYLTAFEGATGKIIDTTDYYLSNVAGSNSVSLTFGDDFGNRSERYNATIGYTDGKTPSAIVGRGYYGPKSGGPGRTVVASYSLENNKLKMNWKFDTMDGDNAKYIGQGNHQIEAGDVDGDGMDEIFTGSLTLDHDGKVLWCTGYGHGDAMHLGDFDPKNPGLEFMKVYEGTTDTPATALGGKQPQNWGMTVQDAKTGKILQAHDGVKDTGRGMIGNIGYKDSYYVAWGAGSVGYWDDKDNNLGDLKLAMNGRIYWDGDLQDELQDHVNVTKWNDSTNSVDTLLKQPDDVKSINGSKGNVNMQGDILGDWREELIAYTVLDSKTEEIPMKYKVNPANPAEDNTPQEIDVVATRTTSKYALRVFTTTIPTEYNFYTLMHDDIYRNSAAAYNNCYNQPPHISWYMNDKIKGSEYTTQPDANVKLIANNAKEEAFDASKLPEGGTNPQPPQGLTDVAGHWAETYINEMVKAGVINGYEDNTFKPDNAIKRSEFIKLVVSALGITPADSYTGACTDLTDHWVAGFAQAAEAAGLIDPALTEGNQMKPDAEITREEMASIVTLAAKSKGVDVSGGSVETFADAADISAWATDYVAGAVKIGIVTGFEEDGVSTFKAQDGANRAQAATMMSRLFAQIK